MDIEAIAIIGASLSSIAAAVGFITKVLASFRSSQIELRYNDKLITIDAKKMTNEEAKRVISALTVDTKDQKKESSEGGDVQS